MSDSYALRYPSVVARRSVADRSPFSQIDSFIPFWAWDLPVKKAKPLKRKQKEGKAAKGAVGTEDAGVAASEGPRIVELKDGADGEE